MLVVLAAICSLKCQQFVFHTRRRLPQRLPRACQNKALCTAFDEFCIKLVLQHRDATRYRGVANTEPLGGVGKQANAGIGEKYSHVIPMHSNPSGLCKFATWVSKNPGCSESCYGVSLEATVETNKK